MIMDKVYGADRRRLGDNEVPYVEDHVVHAAVRSPSLTTSATPWVWAAAAVPLWRFKPRLGLVKQC
ncbi:hypothetical protein ANCDUO_26183 [Ancylostoma duodenale]|uniref:Uncharacterized protein n=1 Tax=Ancylostoma duodenale TaxID=51022 RepID=A0A0C2FAC8_9BILA|nr:hypothetical protein ANCDUO_26183 [Ancylostoma duodenale]